MRGKNDEKELRRERGLKNRTKNIMNGKYGSVREKDREKQGS